MQKEAHEYDENGASDMISMRALQTASLLVSVCCSSALAQADNPQPMAPSGDDATSSVNIKGIRDPEWKPYSAMLKGLHRFEEKHALAPDATLRFILQPRRADIDMNALQLRLESDEASAAIPLEEKNLFTLPVTQDPLHAKADLTLNRKAGSVRWIPYIRSATATDTSRRLGDLRLTCEVHWAIDRDTLPFAMRTTLSALGGPCNFVSQKGTYSFTEPQRIIAATISFNGKTEAVPFSGFSFTPPLRDKDWSDDSMIELTFEKAMSPANVGTCPEWL